MDFNKFHCPLNLVRREIFTPVLTFLQYWTHDFNQRDCYVTGWGVTRGPQDRRKLQQVLMATGENCCAEYMHLFTIHIYNKLFIMLFLINGQFFNMVFVTIFVYCVFGPGKISLLSHWKFKQPAFMLSIHAHSNTREINAFLSP